MDAKDYLASGFGTPGTPGTVWPGTTPYGSARVTRRRFRVWKDPVRQFEDRLAAIEATLKEIKEVIVKPKMVPMQAIFYNAAKGPVSNGGLKEEPLEDLFNRGVPGYDD